MRFPQDAKHGVNMGGSKTLPELKAFLVSEVDRLGREDGWKVDTSVGPKTIRKENLLNMMVAGVARLNRAARDEFWRRAKAELDRLQGLDRPAHYDVYADEPGPDGSGDGAPERSTRGRPVRSRKRDQQPIGDGQPRRDDRIGAAR